MACKSCNGTVVPTYPSHRDTPSSIKMSTGAADRSVSLPEKNYRVPPAPMKSDGYVLPVDKAPTIDEIKSYAYDNSLVTILDDQVLQGINEPEVAPCEETTECGTCEEVSVPKHLNPNFKESLPSAGSTVPTQFLNAIPTRKMKLLGRVGKTMAQFLRGAKGYLFLNDDGEVSVTETINIKLSRLMHKWFFFGGEPFVGNPLPSTYDVVADAEGNVYGQKGLPDEDSIRQWNASEEQWEVIPSTQLANKRNLPAEECIEITGRNAEDLDRILAGQNGLLRLEQTTKSIVDDCGVPQTVTSYVAKVVPDPVESSCNTCPPVLAFVGGSPSWEDPGQWECLRGEDGIDGIDGMNGTDGEDGRAGIDGTQTFAQCCNSRC